MYVDEKQSTSITNIYLPAPAGQTPSPTNTTPWTLPHTFYLAENLQHAQVSTGLRSVIMNIYIKIMNEYSSIYTVNEYKW